MARDVNAGPSSTSDYTNRLALLEGEALLTLMHTPNSWAALEALRIVRVARGQK
jgi:hypothetical protein